MHARIFFIHASSKRWSLIFGDLAYVECFSRRQVFTMKRKKKTTYLLSSSLSGNFLDFQVCLCCRFIKLSLEAGSPVNDWVQGHIASLDRRKGRR